VQLERLVAAGHHVVVAVVPGEQLRDVQLGQRPQQREVRLGEPACAVTAAPQQPLGGHPFDHWWLIS
jgi:hypothetical protein